jgi:hypothetical protein
VIRRTARNFLLGAAATALVGLASAPIHAQASGTTDVDIDFPPILILYYYSDVEVNLPTTVLDDFLGASPTAGTAANGVDHYQQAELPSGAITATAGGANEIVATLSALGTLPGSVDLTAMELTLVNAWAVRALASSTETDYTIFVERGDGTGSPPDIDLVNGTSTITITDSGIRVTGGGGFTAESALLTRTAPGLVTPDTGDVRLILDLSALDEAGLHSSATGVDFTIVAEHL